MSRKKKRGVPTLYSESKVKVGVSLTPTGAKRLGDIARELGLSRSEFVERIARGQFDVSGSGNETTITLETNTEAKTVNLAVSSDENSVAPQVESSVSHPSENQDTTAFVQLQERYQTLQRQSDEQANTINNLEQQLAKCSKLEAQLAKTVPTEDYQQLQKQLEQQLAKCSKLEAQLAKTVPTEDYQQLQKQLEQQLETVQLLETQLAEMVSTEDYQQLQKQLEQQLETVQLLETQLAEMVSTEDYQQLQKQLEQLLQQQEVTVSELRHQLEHQNVSMADLEHQLARIPQLETQLANSIASVTKQLNSGVSLEHSPSPVQIHQQPQPISHQSNTNVGLTDSSESYGALKQKIEEQEKTINNLRQEMSDLRRLATIAESHLGRWRHNTFSH
jgi:DNA repair exonuclease SbcCD ATPase subunit